MIVRMIPAGSITKTARTALVVSSPGMIMPYFVATFIEMSSMSGEVTSMSFMSLKTIFSLIVRSQAMWL